MHSIIGPILIGSTLLTLTPLLWCYFVGIRAPRIVHLTPERIPFAEWGLHGKVVYRKDGAP